VAGHPSVKKRQKEAARKERRDEKAQKRDQRKTDRQNGVERVFDEYGNVVEPEPPREPGTDDGAPAPDAPAAPAV
jgi:hypothetical protein